MKKYTCIFLPTALWLFTANCFSQFTCGSAFTDVRDGQSYNTVLIGSQCWMKENLNYGTYIAIHGGAQTAGEKYCNKAGNVNDPTCAWGGLYEWANLMNGYASCNGTGAPPDDGCATPVQGLCPDEWHIPSHYEWTTLEKNAGSNPGAFPYNTTTTGYLGTDEGGNLKQTGTTNWTTPNTGATDSKNFTALPGGYSWAGSFGSAGFDGYWWISTEVSGTVVWDRHLLHTNAQVHWDNAFKTYGLSCRCVKDNAGLPVELLSFTAFAENNTLVRCEWATASESNNDYFGIERSQDGTTFAQIATAPSKAPGGSSSVTLYYGYDDTDPYKGLSYYRLRQVDFNGTFAYSEVRAVYIGAISIISIFPNPASDYIEYLLGSEEGAEVTITLYDALGREVYNKEETIEKGVITKKISTAALSNGSYLLKITNGHLEKTQRQFVIK